MQDSFFTEIFSDDDIVVLNKKSGLLVAADRYNPDAPRLDVEAEKKFGQLYAVHRIDKETSGIVIYARNSDAHKNLSLQFENRQVEKIYHCLIYGYPTWTDLHVDLRLRPDGDARHRTVVDKKFGKPSITDFHCFGKCGPYSWLSANLKTGRTHQIRAHLLANGYSIVCDHLYGGNQKPVRLSEIKWKWHGDQYEERPLLNRLALHSYKIAFNHPKTGDSVEFIAPYPKDMDATRKQLAKLFEVDPLDPNLGSKKFDFSKYLKP